MTNSINVLQRDKNGQTLNSGCKVLFEKRDESGGRAIGIFSHITPQGDAYIKFENKPYWRKPIKIQKMSDSLESTSNEEDDQEENQQQSKESIQLVNVNERFNINQRFIFMESLVRMVLKRKIVSLVITGEGGLGKSYTVLEQIKEFGLVKPDNLWIVKGYSTAKGLYNTLYEHNDKLIVFDDCDEVLLNDASKNILKGALDSYDERIISWIKQEYGGGESDIPSEFEFTGAVIFISNLIKSKVPQALLSRAANIDLSMSIEDKLDRMRNILPHLEKDVSMDIKMRALELVEKNKYSCRDLNIRTLMKCIKIMNSDEPNQDELAEFMILS